MPPHSPDVFKELPAQICDTCGEDYVDEKIAAQLLSEAEESASTGGEVNVRHYQAA